MEINCDVCRTITQVLMIILIIPQPETMTMNPSASANGSRIAYNTIDGRLFVMDIKISE